MSHETVKKPSFGPLRKIYGTLFVALRYLHSRFIIQMQSKITLAILFIVMVT